MSRNKIKRFLLKTAPIVKIRHVVSSYKKKKGDVTHSDKKELIIAFKTIFAIEKLIETGTYLGEMVSACKNEFKSIISIELNSELAEEAKNYFKKNKHISIICGDSGLMLEKVLKNDPEPKLFWLDAHYSAGITSRSEKFGDTPIARELEVIFSNWINKNVILIDDAHLFTGSNGYPHINDLKKYISDKDINLKFLINRNIICIF